MNLKTFLTLLLLVLYLPAGAQFQGRVFEEDASIKAFAGNNEKNIAWCGGFNNAQFSMGDINNDGLQDLVIFENSMALVRTFLNTGTATMPIYTYAPAYVQPFIKFSPWGYDYLKLEDYNRDGIPDMFVRGAGGFTAFRGYYDQNVLNFTYYKELRYNSPFGRINCYSGGGEIPGIADVDHDGDLDFFGYHEDGRIVYFFKNCQVEHHLPNDSIEVCKPSNCWGNMVQDYDRAFRLNVQDTICNQAFVAPNYDCKGLVHGANAICVLDIDGDGDFDLLDGNSVFKDMQLTVNAKSQYGTRDTMTSQDTAWQKLGVKVNMPYWPAAFHLDIDGDGKKDLIITPHAISLSENYKSIAFYKNTGTATVPNFVYQNDTFLVDKTIDAGTASYPVLYDYNKDGRPDLFVGSHGFYQSDGTFRSKIFYYQNNLVNGVTRFDLKTDNFKNIFSERVQGAYPAFGDLDNDGLDDMVVGHGDGTLAFYKNTASSVGATPVFAQPVLLTDPQGLPLQPTNSACPVIYDIDKDGHKDLLVTGEIGTVQFYKNNGNSGPVNLTFVTSQLGGMRGSDRRFYSMATLFIGKIDNTGKDYILLGNDTGIIRRYNGFQDGNVNIQYQLIDTQYSYIANGGRSAVTVGDVDGDGKYEMFVGNLLGGLWQYRQKLNVATNVGVSNVYTAGSCHIYPNPATNTLYIKWDEAFGGHNPVSIRLVSMTGQLVQKQEAMGTAGIVALPVVALPAGIYMCLLQSGANSYTQKITIGE